MKTLFTIITLFAFILATSNHVVAGEIKSATLKIEGMTCKLCPPMVKKAISKVEGVKDVHVDFEKKEAYVEYDEGAVKPEDLIKAVEKVGFKAKIGKGADK